jgi:hypothetical protein
MLRMTKACLLKQIKTNISSNAGVVLKQLKDVFNSIVKGEGCTNNK